jgi:uncharacterized protein (DUF3820 family)
MENMELFRLFEKTADEAKKPIEAGRLKGFTDINPMWRFKRLTEVFGPVGIGWKYVITDKQIIPGADGVVSAFVDILLFYKYGGEWSEGIPGTGGSSFVAKESKGLYTSDECFKMALSDAIGTACKALGMSADIYFSKDRSKYTAVQEAPEAKMETVEDAANYVLTFGKHKGRTLGDLYKNERDYLIWLYDNEKTDPIIKKGMNILHQAVRNSR